MKKILPLLLIFAASIARAQQSPPPVIVTRTPPAVLPVDYHLFTKDLKIPVYADTAHALAAAGRDSIGLIFKELNTSNVWVRDSNLVAGGHIWTKLGAGGGTGTPAGSNTQVQINNSGAFGAVPNFTANPSSHVVNADSTTSHRNQTDAVLLNKTPWAVPTGLLVLGNSYDAGYRPCSPDTTYITRLGTGWGLTVTNHAISSSGTYSAVGLANTYLTGNTSFATFMGTIGFNDVRSQGFPNISSNRMISGGMNAIWFAHFLKSSVFAGTGTGVTRYGSWSTSANTGAWGGKAGTSGAFSHTVNDSIVYVNPAADSSIGVSLIGMYYGGATYNVYLDGVLKGKYTVHGAAPGIADGLSNPDTYSPFVQMWTGLSYRIHHLTIVNTSSDSLYVDYFGQLRDASTATPLFVMKSTYNDSTGNAITGTGPANGPSAFSHLNDLIDSLAQTWNQHYPWYLLNSNIDTLSGICSGDHVHPNNLGDSIFAASVLAQFPSLTSPQQWAQISQGTKRPEVNRFGGSQQIPDWNEVLKRGDLSNVLHNTPLLQQGQLSLTGTPYNVLRLVDGNQGAGKTIVSDANGNMSWGAPGGSSAGSLGYLQYSGGSGTFAGNSGAVFDPTNGGIYVNGLAMQAFNTSNAFIGYNAKVVSGGAAYNHIVAGYATILQFPSSGGLQIGTAGTGAAGSAITFNNFPLYINTTGQVQIGGNVSFSPSSYVDLPASTSSLASLYIAPGGAPTTGLKTGLFYTTSTGHFNFYNGSAFQQLDLSGGTINQLTYWNGTNGVGSFAYGYVDPTNKKIGFGGAITSTITGDEQVRVRDNRTAEFRIQNDSAGTAAAAMFQSVNDASNNLQVKMFSSGFTSSGMNIANAGMLTTNGPGGLSIDVNGGSSAPLMFGTNNTERARITGGGNFLLGTTSDLASSIFTMSSTIQGFRPPSMTTTQRNAISSPTAGLTIYNNETHKINWYDSVNAVWRVALDSASAPSGSSSGNIWSQTASGTALTNTTTQASILGTGTGSLTIPANTLTVGKVITMHGFLTVSHSSSGGSILLVPMIGSGSQSLTIGAPTSSILSAASEITATYTILTTGTSATAYATLKVNWGNSTDQVLSNFGTITIGNTASTIALDLQAAWGTASSSNSVQTVPYFTVKIE